MNVENIDLKSKVPNNQDIKASAAKDKPSAGSLEDRFFALIQQIISGAGVDGVEDSLEMLSKAVLDSRLINNKKVEEEKKEVEKEVSVKEENLNKEEIFVEAKEEENHQEVVESDDPEVEKEEKVGVEDSGEKEEQRVLILEKLQKNDLVEDVKKESEEYVLKDENDLIYQQLNSKSQSKNLREENSSGDLPIDELKEIKQDTVNLQDLKQQSIKNPVKKESVSNYSGKENDLPQEVISKIESIFNANGKTSAPALTSVKDLQQNINLQNAKMLLAELVNAKTVSKLENSSANLDFAGMNSNLSADRLISRVKQANSKLPTRYSEQTLEKVKELLAKAAQNRDGNTLTLRLDPKDLGQIMVKVTQRENTVYARIVPESVEVENLLRASVAELTQVLSQAGIKQENLHLSIGKERAESEAYRFSEFLNAKDNQRQADHFSDRRNNNESLDKEGYNFGMNNITSQVKLDDNSWVA